MFRFGDSHEKQAVIDCEASIEVEDDFYIAYADYLF
jgi:hypothetical protein